MAPARCLDLVSRRPATSPAGSLEGAGGGAAAGTEVARGAVVAVSALSGGNPLGTMREHPVSELKLEPSVPSGASSSEARCLDLLSLWCLLCVLLVVLPPVQDLERRVEIIGAASVAPSVAPSTPSLPSGRWLDATPAPTPNLDDIDMEEF